MTEVEIKLYYEKVFVVHVHMYDESYLMEQVLLVRSRREGKTTTSGHIRSLTLESMATRLLMSISQVRPK